MPLDSSDYDHIQSAIDKVSAKLDTVVAGLVARGEYEARHANLTRRVDDHDAALRDFRTYGYHEMEKIRQERKQDMAELDAKFDKRFAELDTKFDELLTAISDNRLATLRYIITVIVSFFTGSGLIGTLIAFHVIH